MNLGPQVAPDQFGVNGGARLCFCRAGRDRTGFVSAVIQMALGVDKEAIIADYVRSNAHFLPMARRLLIVLKVFSLSMFPTSKVRIIFTTQERYIHTIIGKIENDYGGIGNYLAQCGIGAAELAAMRELLLDVSAIEG